ncbi:hypothetical protein WJX72_007187 [[Myrmecia] bisecta]|uniref:JmjC domain-containing protein n=1 Tax=[Myrmecia] bisecta TaxID=41462 RepID=A0AAW1Q7R5_9CHLO
MPADLTEQVSEATLRSLLTCKDKPQATEGDPALARCLKIAAHVFNAWTGCGARPAGLADRFLDGSIDVLESFVRSSPQPSEQNDRLDSPDALLRTSPGSTRREVRDSRPAGLPQLEVRQAAELSYDAFVHEYMAPNRPVLIQSAANDWKAMRDWVTADGGVDIDFFEAQFGSAHVWVTDTGRQHSGCGSRRDMTVAEFAQYWRRFQAGQERDILYLKDWHFANEFPGYKAYQLPHYFREDWLNEYYDMRQSAARTAPAAPAHECGDGATEAAGEPSRRQADIVTSDYRFVYLGPKGTWTPLHADVLRSYSWSTNVCGRKRWLLLPPQHTHLLYDRFGREMAPDFGLGPETACADVLQQFPNLERAAQLVIECIQEPGDTIFVPSGWHHTVENLADTLSINHNWLNGYNIHWGWELLQREYQEAAEAIEDCRPMCEPAEFEGLVQRNLAANCGLDYRSMADFVGAIAQRELAAIRRPGGPLPQLLAHAFNLQRAGFVLKGLAEAMARSQCASGGAIEFGWIPGGSSDDSRRAMQLVQ